MKGLLMKKSLLRYTAFLFAVVALVCFTTSASAKIEWEFLNDLPIAETPKDIALTKDGGTVYILGTDNIHIFSLRENKVTNTIPLESSFSKIALSPEGNRVFLTNTKNNKISIIEISEIYDIEIENSAVIGNRDAKANVVAFLDYQ